MKSQKSRTVEELAVVEFVKNARILQRQLKIMRGIGLSSVWQVKTKDIIANLEKEFAIYKM